MAWIKAWLAKAGPYVTAAVAWLKAVNWGRWWPVPAVALALMVGYCAHPTPVAPPPPPPVYVSPPVAPCDCAKPAVVKPTTKNLRGTHECRYVPDAAYTHPKAKVLAEAKRRGTSAENMAQLRKCIGA